MWLFLMASSLLLSVLVANCSKKKTSKEDTEIISPTPFETPKSPKTTPSPGQPSSTTPKGQTLTTSSETPGKKSSKRNRGIREKRREQGSSAVSQKPRAQPPTAPTSGKLVMNKTTDVVMDNASSMSDEASPGGGRGKGNEMTTEGTQMTTGLTLNPTQQTEIP